MHIGKPVNIYILYGMGTWIRLGSTGICSSIPDTCPPQRQSWLIWSCILANKWIFSYYMEWVLRSDSEVRVLLLNTQYLPTSKTMLIDLKLGILKNAETFCGHGRLDVVVATFPKLLYLWITSPVMHASFTWTHTWSHPYLNFILYPIPDPNLFFHTCPSPSYHGYRVSGKTMLKIIWTSKLISQLTAALIYYS